MTTIFEKPRFWVTFSIISALMFGFAWHYFPKALPIMQLNITMDREQAITDARNLAQQYGWQPQDAQTSTSFDTDSTTKTFIELAGGGQQAFTDMVHNEWYMPYQWNVRLFKEFVTQETHVYFTPAGVPYGFEYKIAEDDELPSLTDQQARSLAEETAQQAWHIDLTPYTLFETANKRQPNGRVDHTFVYQRTDRDLKDGKYRVRIVVSGDKVTEINHYVHVPQEFLLKYREMRSANESIANAAAVFAYIFYMLLGAIIALFLLIRTGWVIWRAPIIWAGIVALLNFLADLNSLPLEWMHYYTEHPMHSFLVNLLVHAGFNLFMNFIMFSLIFIAAESLTRRAFGGSAQLWRSWDKGVANSYTILGYTIGGYLQVGIDLAFLVAFYYIATNYLGWWSPIGHLANPNILAEYLPWLSPIAISLRAAFVEECKFRAIPLAGAALIGTRLGHRRAWIVAACIVQALVFSGAHANYTSVPAYARLVELIIPSLIYAGIYLRFGLLVTVITHFVYDVVWFALPLFVAHTPYAWVNQILVLLGAFMPLFVVLYRRLQASAWQHLPYDKYNSAWKPNALNTAAADATTSMLVLPSNKKLERISPILIALSIGIWFIFTKFTPDAPPLGVGRAEATELARTALSSTYPALTEELATLYPVSMHEKKYQGFGESRGGLQHKYIWQTYGKETYDKLMGSFLYPPMWRVRFLQFNGDLIERAYHIAALVGATTLSKHPTYAPLGVTYSLPDQVPGNTLAEKDARVIADRALVDKGIDLTTTKLVSAVAHKHPERQDWAFTYAHTQLLPQEQARTVVVVEGDEVHYIHNEIHVPESWQREQTRHEGTGNALMTLMHLLLRMLFIGGTIYALLQWAYRRISGRVFFTKFIGFAVISILTVINDFTQVIAQFNTQEPFANQVLINLNVNFLQLLLRCGIFAFVASYLMSYRPAHRYKSQMSRILAGITSGSIIVAVTALLGYFKPSLEPTWPNYNAIAGWSPVLAFILSHTLEFLILCMTYALVYIIITYINNRHPKLQPLAVIICILGGLCSYGMQPIDSIPFWLMAGTTIGITFYALWFIFMRYAYSSIIFTGAVQMTFAILLQMWYAPFNNAILAGIITIIIIMGIASVWLKEYEQNIKRETVNFDL
jgi:hypothetical protein